MIKNTIVFEWIYLRFHLKSKQFKIMIYDKFIQLIIIIILNETLYLLGIYEIIYN